jgi:uncharacterized protein YbcC (UPF0753/DUF2309 family)
MSIATDTLSFESILSRIRTKLPIQNPLPTFVHNNILMMFEGKEFHEALADAGTLYRATTYWPIEKYKAQYEEKKIMDRDINDGIDHYILHYNNSTAAEKLGLSLKDYYTKLMFSELIFNDDEIQPDILHKELWAKSAQKMSGQHLTLPNGPKKYRAKQYWEKYYNESTASTTHPYIINLISSFLDQGQGFWANPYIEKGFWNFFCDDMNITKNFGAEWQKLLGKKLEEFNSHTPQQIIEHELTKMEIPREVWESFLLDILFDLKGWSGMVNKLELEPWQATVKAPNIKLVEFIAALLLIESSLDQYHSQLHSTDLAMIYGREEVTELHSFSLSLALYQITKCFKLKPTWMDQLDPAEIVKIIDLVAHSEKEHLIRLWHEAYEHQFYRDALNAIISHETPLTAPIVPEAQVLFCIDDREESIRRHLEEVTPTIKTYGVVGFFGIDMKFSSLKSKRQIAQCPPVVVPSRTVQEIPRSGLKTNNFFWLHNFKGGSDLSLYYLSRTLFRGFFSTLILGVMSIVPMFLQVFFPKQSKRFRDKFNDILSPTPITEMDIEQTKEGQGYTKLEMAKIVQAILNMCGFGNEFSRLVVMAGHGSTSNNNPFKQAYGCGACGGNAGIPNSRAFAKMANDPEVRKNLATLGVNIPVDTYFLSGFHDTCIDEILFFDIDLLPKNYVKDFERVKTFLDHACKLNAFERCQRFSSSEAKDSPEKALKHVRERAEDLAQPRPEYGHSTNALSIVGHRDMTRGLFLNRRSFLLTYDWQLDPEGTVLHQIVLGGIPVSVNISMDYYFSCVDNDNFGCGSKLPLNLTSLLGVMTGSSSDLRIGLARQMVEIHEPIRQMIVIQAPLARVHKTFNSHPRLRNILYNHWMRLTVYDPEAKVWYLFKGNDFQEYKNDHANVKHFNRSLERFNELENKEDFAEIG